MKFVLPLILIGNVDHELTTFELPIYMSNLQHVERDRTDSRLLEFSPFPCALDIAGLLQTELIRLRDDAADERQQRRDLWLVQASFQGKLRHLEVDATLESRSPRLLIELANVDGGCTLEVLGSLEDRGAVGVGMEFNLV